jgi:hypothetical protein
MTYRTETRYRQYTDRKRQAYRTFERDRARLAEIGYVPKSVRWHLDVGQGLREPILYVFLIFSVLTIIFIPLAALVLFNMIRDRDVGTLSVVYTRVRPPSPAEVEAEDWEEVRRYVDAAGDVWNDAARRYAIASEQNDRAGRRQAVVDLQATAQDALAFLNEDEPGARWADDHASLVQGYTDAAYWAGDALAAIDGRSSTTAHLGPDT